jgi:hypothetical protein
MTQDKQQQGNEREETHIAAICVSERWWNVEFIVRVRDDKPIEVVVMDVRQSA